MKKIITGIVAGAALVVTLAACSGGPSVSACKSAMKAEYAGALTSGQQGSEPAACKGIPDATLTKLADQIMTGS